MGTTLSLLITHPKLHMVYDLPHALIVEDDTVRHGTLGYFTIEFLDLYIF